MEVKRPVLRRWGVNVKLFPDFGEVRLFSEGLLVFIFPFKKSTTITIHTNTRGKYNNLEKKKIEQMKLHKENDTHINNEENKIAKDPYNNGQCLIICNLYTTSVFI